MMQRLCQKHRLPEKSLSAAGRRRLAGHPWPGNVRELAPELERAIVFEDGEVLNFTHLGTGELAGPGDVENGWFNPNFHFPEQGFDLEQAIRSLIDRALQQTDNNVSAAARVLGVTRDYLRYRLAGEKKAPTDGE